MYELATEELKFQRRYKKTGVKMTLMWNYIKIKRPVAKTQCFVIVDLKTKSFSQKSVESKLEWKELKPAAKGKGY